MIDNNPVWPFVIDTAPPFAYWQEAFSKQECEQIIALGKDLNPTPGTIKAETHDQNTEKYRESNVSWIYPYNNEWIYQKMTTYLIHLNNNFFKYDLSGFIEGLQFTEYNAPDGKYDEHIDIIKNGIIRKLSVIVQLSDPNHYEGGELELLVSKYPSTLEKTQGNIYVFPSYHLHRVNPVTKGTRYSLVGWVSGPPFK